MSGGRCSVLRGLARALVKGLWREKSFVRYWKLWGDHSPPGQNPRRHAEPLLIWELSEILVETKREGTLVGPPIGLKRDRPPWGWGEGLANRFSLTPLNPTASDKDHAACD